MTVAELRDKLAALPPDLEVAAEIRTHTSAVTGVELYERIIYHPRDAHLSPLGVILTTEE